MSLKKIRVLPDQYIFKQNDKGNTAYLVISGGLVAELDNKKIGKIETGEIFGELSLILGENRTCSIKAVVPTEVVEIKKKSIRRNTTIIKLRITQGHPKYVSRIKKKGEPQITYFI